MINVLIKDEDVLYRYGLEAIIARAFVREFIQPPIIKYHYTPENIREADIIVLSLHTGGHFHCAPELSMRKKGIVIGLVDDRARASALTPCIDDILVLPRKITCDRFSQILYFAWKKEQLLGTQISALSCQTCPHKALSGKQHQIMNALYKGKTVVEIADELHISDKTVYNHKYAVMKKFNLRSDFELVLFLNKLHQGNALAV
ncbi:helix-turn-helix transcriptional regulator [Enterobacter sp. C4G1]|uniref:helix-turn-helix transcriptional regulator n=1 Tax=Enterobacter sp. C4G1 TaxID=3458724 RepID=UPI0040679222